MNLILPLLTVIQFLVVQSDDCWWTGCQKNDWAVVGCEQYNRTESKIKKCDNGHEYYCCVKLENVQQISTRIEKKENCWWTGCQKNNWAVVGCGQYVMAEEDLRNCDNGHEYYCCPKSSKIQSSTVQQIESLKDCWWTGCQKNNWAEVGCGQYNMTERNIKNCDNGHEYHCCPKSSGVSIRTTERSFETPKDCWWTGCQKNDWAEVGCGQYDMIEYNVRNCEKGREYHCCPKELQVSSRTTESSIKSPNDCWWTGCQKNNWAIRGCEQYNRTQSEKRNCEDGEEYNCCVKSSDTVSVSSPVENDDLECWWSSCQPFNWTDRGCLKDMEQVGLQFCGEDEGEIFHCCGKLTFPEPSDYDESTGESYVDYVKYLLFKGKNFTIEPESLPCTTLDKEKKGILKIGNDGIRICDLCPSFPQKMLVDVFLNNDPSIVLSNAIFEECFGNCYNRNDCMAFSYDNDEYSCYIFNNTIGTYVSDSNWTTVIMSQPVGIIEGWSYSRHTSILGEEIYVSKEKSFLNCLEKCNVNENCNYISYDLMTLNCSTFASDSNVSYIDLNYGHISAMRISSMPSEEVTSRFIEQGDDFSNLFKNDRSEENIKCSEEKNGTHGAFFSKECLLSSPVSCNTETGCKKCYYPEKAENSKNLPICPDSDYVVLSDIKKNIQILMEECLHDKNCVGVGFNALSREVQMFTFDSFADNEFSTWYILRYPLRESSYFDILTKYDFLLYYDIDKSWPDARTFHEFSVETFEECVEIFESNAINIWMSYSKKKCKISSADVKFIYSNTQRVITITKKPPLTSSLISFVITPALSIQNNVAKRTDENCKNCETDCAKKCYVDYSMWCSHFTIEIESTADTNKYKCLFFDLFNDTYALTISLTRNENSRIYTKISSLDFTLNSLNKLSPFQYSDVLNCFQSISSSDQTQRSLSVIINSDTSIKLRRKRGFFDWIGNAFKAVGNAIVDVAKSIVEPIVDTVKGVANGIKHVIDGNFDKAKEAVLSIPIVKDVKNAVEFGGAVINGDWDAVKEKGAELLQSSTLDLATSFIPVGGKFIGKGLGAIGKAIGKSTSKISKGANKVINKTRGKNSKVKNGKKKKTKDKSKDDNKENKKNEKRNQCKRRQKRAAAGQKRKKPGDCDDDDDSCSAPTIAHVITDKGRNNKDITGCKNHKLNAKCEYECLPGYDEPKRTVTCTKSGNNDPDWSPKPVCTAVDCPNNAYPLIPLHTPQVSSFGNLQLGRHLTAYVVLFNKARRLPIWSVALHQSEQYQSNDYTQLKSASRASDFRDFPCAELKGHQAHKNDYEHSGWDRGHLTPANVAKWSSKAALSSNLYINVAPQDPYTNQIPWKDLEAHIECSSKKRRTLVATGICDEKIDQTASGLEVPKCFWKMICYKDEAGREQVIGFMADNSHPNMLEPAAKQKRTSDVFTAYYPSEIKKLFPKQFDPWIMTAKEINKGRQVQLGTNPTVWMPINPFDCAAAKDSSAEKEAWTFSLLAFQFDKLSINEKYYKKKKATTGTGSPRSKKSRKPRKKTKTKRAANNQPKLKRGCNSKSELRNMRSLVSLGSEDDEDLDDEDYEKDDGRGLDMVQNVQKCNKRIIGYYTSWLDKEIESRQLERLTHVIYAFLEMKDDGSIEVGSADRKNSKDVNKEMEKAKSRLVNLMALAKSYNHLKVMFAVGGWENSQYFSSTAASSGKRVTFIASIVKLIKKYGFDGVDIDWEYPVTGGANEGVPQDKQNYVLLMKELRLALNTLATETGRKDEYLISFAGAAGQWTLDPGFDLPGLLKYVSFANIMTYDYFGAWASKWGAYTGPPAPLHFGMPSGFSGKTNVDWSVKHYTCKTKLPHKINMGVPFYGRYWKNVGAPVNAEDNMWRKSTAVNGKFEGGYVPWYEVESFISTEGLQQSFHEKSKTPYAFNAGTKTFLGYENVKSLEFKVKYAEEKNIGGLMIWAVEQDDDNLSLLKTIASANLCKKTNPTEVNFKCIPIEEKRWWTPEDGEDKAGLCGKSAPLYKGYYPVCDPDDPGYNCCGPAGYCGTGEKYCSCPTCKDYAKDPNKILEKPIKPTVPVTWYLLNDADGKRGRCGRQIPKIKGIHPTCNPDDENSHCCSNGGYCGSTDAHCKCNGCIDFKAKPNYRFGPKKWWDQSDGEEKQGKCGPKAPKVDGIYEAECETNTQFNCCSADGFCGSGKDYCDCDGCKKYTD